MSSWIDGRKADNVWRSWSFVFKSENLAQTTCAQNRKI